METPLARESGWARRLCAASVVGLLLTCACEREPGNAADASDAASVVPDAAGPRFDSGPPSPTDAGMARDAASDAGATPDAAPSPDAGTHADAGSALDAGDDEDAGNNVDAGRHDDDAGAPPTCNAPADLGRGLTWVRANPMMISGLAVAMGPPSGDAVGAYFDEFHATAVHLWENGLPTEMAAWSDAAHPAFRYVTWVHRDGTSVSNGQVLGGNAPLPGRIGYQIGDEPTDDAALQAITAGAAVVRTADPDGLRIINLNDSDGANTLRAQAAALEDIDILSYDHYDWGTGAQSGLMSTREAALTVGKPYWRYIKSFHYKDESPEGTESDLRWDALVGAPYGFSGYTWFVYSIAADNESVAPLLFSTGGDYAATRTALYATAASLNRALANLGRALVRLRSVDVRYQASITWLRPSGLDAWSAGAGGDPYLVDVALGGQRDLLIGHFRDDCNEPYVMVQNQAHAGGDFPNRSSSPATFTLTFDFSGANDPALDTTAVLALDPDTGTVAPRALTATSTGAELVLELPAGGVFFFKYRNAYPFTLQ